MTRQEFDEARSAAHFAIRDTMADAFGLTPAKDPEFFSFFEKANKSAGNVGHVATIWLDARWMIHPSRRPELSEWLKVRGDLAWAAIFTPAHAEWAGKNF